MANEFQEIQRDARFSVNLSVNCYPSFDAGVKKREVLSEEVAFEGEVRNISSGGACLTTSLPLKVKEILKVSFPIQAPVSNFISPLRTLVEVRWTKPDIKDKFIVGVRFLL